MEFIIKNKNTYGKTRVEQESNLRKDGMVGMSDENFEKAKYIEKKMGIKSGFLRQEDISRLK